jgi:hypothetical protein
VQNLFYVKFMIAPEKISLWHKNAEVNSVTTCDFGVIHEQCLGDSKKQNKLQKYIHIELY